MKKLFGVAVLLGSAVATVSAIYAAEKAPTDPNYPAWAYAIPEAPPPGSPPIPPPRDDGKVLTLPGTDKQFTFNQARGRRDDASTARIPPGDWYPGDHPPMPKLVAEGDEARGIVACSLCHYPNGKGRSENASPQGLPKDYMVRQLHNMKDDLRTSADRRKTNTQVMVGFAKAMTDEEMEETSAYFASMPWTPWIKVVETATVPKTHSPLGFMAPLTGAQAGTEPIGKRIIEVPENVEYAERYRNPRSPNIAYVPPGSIAKGQQLVWTGGHGKTQVCAVCHGEDLNGRISVPGIAARSPSYIVRQLYDIQKGTRHGGMADLMKQIVENLDADDFINIGAYLASLPAPAKGPELTETK
jgi:cytochrome c553